MNETRALYLIISVLLLPNSAAAFGDQKSRESSKINQFSNALNHPTLGDAVDTSTANNAELQDNEDFDVFVAEISTERPSDFEKLFRPLSRYKKAVLGVDAQIEAGENQRRNFDLKARYHGATVTNKQNNPNFKDLDHKEKTANDERTPSSVDDTNEQINSSYVDIDDMTTANGVLQFDETANINRAQLHKNLGSISADDRKEVANGTNIDRYSHQKHLANISANNGRNGAIEATTLNVERGNHDHIDDMTKHPSDVDKSEDDAESDTEVQGSGDESDDDNESANGSTALKGNHNDTDNKHGKYTHEDRSNDITKQMPDVNKSEHFVEKEKEVQESGDDSDSGSGESLSGFSGDEEASTLIQQISHQLESKNHSAFVRPSAADTVNLTLSHINNRGNESSINDNDNSSTINDTDNGSSVNENYESSVNNNDNGSSANDNYSGSSLDDNGRDNDRDNGSFFNNSDNSSSVNYNDVDNHNGSSVNEKDRDNYRDNGSSVNDNGSSVNDNDNYSSVNDNDADNHNCSSVSDNGRDNDRENGSSVTTANYGRLMQISSIIKDQKKTGDLHEENEDTESDKKEKSYSGTEVSESNLTISENDNSTLEKTHIEIMNQKKILENEASSDTRHFGETNRDLTNESFSKENVKENREIQKEKKAPDEVEELADNETRKTRKNDGEDSAKEITTINRRKKVELKEKDRDELEINKEDADKVYKTQNKQNSNGVNGTKEGRAAQRQAYKKLDNEVEAVEANEMKPNGRLGKSRSQEKGLNKIENAHSIKTDINENAYRNSEQTNFDGVEDKALKIKEGNIGEMKRKISTKVQEAAVFGDKDENENKEEINVGSGNRSRDESIKEINQNIGGKGNLATSAIKQIKLEVQNETKMERSEKKQRSGEINEKQGESKEKEEFSGEQDVEEITRGEDEITEIENSNFDIENNNESRNESDNTIINQKYKDKSSPIDNSRLFDSEIDDTKQQNIRGETEKSLKGRIDSYTEDNQKVNDNLSSEEAVRKLFLTTVENSKKAVSTWKSPLHSLSQGLDHAHESQKDSQKLTHITNKSSRERNSKIASDEVIKDKKMYETSRIDPGFQSLEASDIISKKILENIPVSQYIGSIKIETNQNYNFENESSQSAGQDKKNVTQMSLENYGKSIDKFAWRGTKDNGKSAQNVSVVKIEMKAKEKNHIRHGSLQRAGQGEKNKTSASFENYGQSVDRYALNSEIDDRKPGQNVHVANMEMRVKEKAQIRNESSQRTGHYKKNMTLMSFENYGKSIIMIDTRAKEKNHVRHDNSQSQQNKKKMSQTPPEKYGAFVNKYAWSSDLDNRKLSQNIPVSKIEMRAKEKNLIRHDSPQRNGQDKQKVTKTFPENHGKVIDEYAWNSKRDEGRSGQNISVARIEMRAKEKNLIRHDTPYGNGQDKEKVTKTFPGNHRKSIDEYAWNSKRDEGKSGQNVSVVRMKMRAKEKNHIRNESSKKTRQDRKNMTRISLENYGKSIEKFAWKSEIDDRKSGQNVPIASIEIRGKEKNQIRNESLQRYGQDKSKATKAFPEYYGKSIDRFGWNSKKDSEKSAQNVVVGNLEIRAKEKNQMSHGSSPTGRQDEKKVTQMPPEKYEALVNKYAWNSEVDYRKLAQNIPVAKIEMRAKDLIRHDSPQRNGQNKKKVTQTFPGNHGKSIDEYTWNSKRDEGKSGQNVPVARIEMRAKEKNLIRHDSPQKARQDKKKVTQTWDSEIYNRKSAQNAAEKSMSLIGRDSKNTKPSKSNESGSVTNFRIDTRKERKKMKEKFEKMETNKDETAETFGNNTLPGDTKVHSIHLPLLNLPPQMIHYSRMHHGKNKMKRKRKKQLHRRHKAMNKHAAYKTSKNHRVLIKAKIHGRKKGRHNRLKFKNDIAFETMLMSQKARRLYLHLIHDTRKAFVNRKHHREKWRRKHSMRRKKYDHNKSNYVEVIVAAPSHKQIQKQAHFRSNLKFKITNGQRNRGFHPGHGHRRKNLASRILNTMAEKENLPLNQTLHPGYLKIEASRKGDLKVVSKPVMLDTKETLLGKLAELSYETKSFKTPLEIPKLPKESDAHDGILINGTTEFENPGKTVLQAQRGGGLDANIDMDKLEGLKENSRNNSWNGNIEVEVTKNETQTRSNQQSDIGQLSVKQMNESGKNFSQPVLVNRFKNDNLSEYNEEERLKSPDLSEEEDDDITDSMYLQSMPQHFHLQDFLTNARKSEETEKENDNDNHGPYKYFVGNSSLWRNPQIVSMNITPLVDVFYQVNHQNLIDLVENEASSKQQEKHYQQYTNGLQHAHRQLKTSLRSGNHKTGMSLEYGVQKARGSKIRRTDYKKTAKKPKHHQQVKRIKKKRKHHERRKPSATTRSELNSNSTEIKPNPPTVPDIKNNMPKNVQYYKIENTEKLGAVCIDGSTPGYYFRPGYELGKNKWIIHLHGGAWCYNLQTCYRRSLSVLGSTHHWSAENITNFFQGVLSDKMEVNPKFHNWNVVVQTYCDGGLFSGDRKDPLVYGNKKLYFRGRRILKAMLDSLKRRGLKLASDVILSGTSAGGLAVVLQGDYIRRGLPKMANVTNLIDAGFFINSPGPEWPNIIRDQFKGLYAIHQPKLKHKCERDRIDEERYMCLFPQYFLKYTSSPAYFVNSLYDHWQLSELQGLTCVYNNDKCTQREREQILRFRNVMFSTMNQTLREMKSAGLFANSCLGHGQAIVDYTWSRVRVNNRTIRDSFNDWLNEQKNYSKHFLVDCRYPCNGSCPKPMVNACVQNFKRTSSIWRVKRDAVIC